MTNLIDETGNRYGHWTVIKRAKNKGRCTAWLCQCDCGNEGVVRGCDLRNGRSKSCRQGPCHPLWKGGKFTKRGYVMTLKRGHPNSAETGYVQEHVFVMAEHLGRALRAGETVHHINGIRADNRIENLELWASNHPAGQRVSDLRRRMPSRATQYKQWAAVRIA